jgi:uncharacterized Zn-binding protein involved in type VI secretion
MFDGPVPHVGGVILETTADNIILGILPAATIGSTAMCIGPPASIVDGSPAFIADIMPVATMTSMTDHGGIILEGEPTIIV